MSQKKKIAVTDLLNHSKPWQNNENDVWLASVIRLFRNVENFPFPSKLSKEQTGQICALVGRGLLELKGFDEPSIYYAEQIDPLEKEYLFEHFFSMQSFHQAHAGEAFVIDKSGVFLGIINIRDHIQLQITDCKGDLEESWNRLATLETELGKKVQYAYSSKFGFLSADPDHCGTGLVVYAFLHLPALIQGDEITAAIADCCGNGVETTSLHGTANSYIGDIVTLHNNHTLGLTEEEIVASIRSSATRLMVKERSLRKKFKEEENSNIKDRISRAYGLLIHSYQLETLEAMNAISLLKLGLNLGWIKGVTYHELNQAFFNSRRAHLLAAQEDNCPPEELLHARAKLIHEILANTELVI